jgi:hypothetical protein
MDDASNNIFDPSCNPTPPPNNPTAIVTHSYPNVVYVSMQQPAYDVGGTVEFYDISKINIIPEKNDKFSYQAVVGEGEEYDSTEISEGTPEVLYGHTSSTRWIKVTFPVDLSTNDLSLNFYGDEGIRDQNGGILQSFTELDICSNVLWRDVSGNEGVAGVTDKDGAHFENGYPAIFSDTSTTQVYCRWNPDFTDFEGTPHDSFTLMDNDGNKISCISQEAEQRPLGENILKLIEGIGLTNFQALMARHNDPGRSDIYGTPDLYLWATSKAKKTIKYIRFVEVKRPTEHLKVHQKDEIAYLNDELNLKARVLRLKEVSGK